MMQRPNILWIVTDHQLHASQASMRDWFPLQKRLSRLGVEFTRAYTALPICSPARASMLTGLYPHAHGLTENDGRFGGREGLEPSDWMIHHALSAAGYRCGWFGKWHVNNHLPAGDFGFEGFSLPGYGYPYGSDEYLAYLNRSALANPVAIIQVGGESGLTPGTEVDLIQATDWFDYESGVAKLNGAAAAHESFFLAELAKRWVETIEEEPFFLKIDTWGPHPPYLLAEPFLGMVDDRKVQLPQNFNSDLKHRPAHHRVYRDYWNSTLNLDTHEWRQMYVSALEHATLVETAICTLLDHIDLKNTLVIFNSDHGDAVGSNGGIANKGGLMVEATMQIPLYICGPGVPRGEVRDQLVCNLDLTPTLLDYCQINCDRTLHGQPLHTLFSDNSASLRQGLMTQHFGLHEPISQRAWYQHEFKLVLQEDGFCELYNLDDDPHEMENLASDDRYRTISAQLQRELAIAMYEVGDTDTRICQHFAAP